MGSVCSGQLTYSNPWIPIQFDWVVCVCVGGGGGPVTQTSGKQPVHVQGGVYTQRRCMIKKRQPLFGPI